VMRFAGTESVEAGNDEPQGAESGDNTAPTAEGASGDHQTPRELAA
jgi:hypothetical protein